VAVRKFNPVITAKATVVKTEIFEGAKSPRSHCSGETDKTSTCTTYKDCLVFFFKSTILGAVLSYEKNGKQIKDLSFQSLAE